MRALVGPNQAAFVGGEARLEVGRRHHPRRDDADDGRAGEARALLVAETRVAAGGHADADESAGQPGEGQEPLMLPEGEPAVGVADRRLDRLHRSAALRRGDDGAQH